MELKHQRKASCYKSHIVLIVLYGIETFGKIAAPQCPYVLIVLYGIETIFLGNLHIAAVES